MTKNQNQLLKTLHKIEFPNIRKERPLRVKAVRDLIYNYFPVHLQRLIPTASHWASC